MVAAVNPLQQPSIIEAAYAIAAKRSQKAREAFLTLPRNPSRDSLEKLLGYVAARRS